VVWGRRPQIVVSNDLPFFVFVNVRSNSKMLGLSLIAFARTAGPLAASPTTRMPFSGLRILAQAVRTDALPSAIKTVIGNLSATSD